MGLDCLSPVLFISYEALPLGRDAFGWGRWVAYIASMSHALESQGLCIYK